MILALETGGELASLALLDGLDVAAEHAFRHRMTLSKELLPAVHTLLGQAGAGWNDVEAVAVGLGPGSYTGLRIGLVTAKALAWASGRPVLGVPSLAALVAPYPAPIETLLCAVLEARAGEFYTALYQRRDGELHVRAEPTVLAAAELAARLESYPGPVLLAGHARRFARQTPVASRQSPEEDTESGAGSVDGGVKANSPSGLATGDWRLASTGLDEEPQARWIGRLAVRRLGAGERDHPAALAPLYVRQPAPTLKPGATSGGAEATAKRGTEGE